MNDMLTIFLFGIGIGLVFGFIGGTYAVIKYIECHGIPEDVIIKKDEE